MQKLQVETAQNVIIEQEIANIGERIAAFLIDGVILYAYIFIMMLIFGQLGSSGNNTAGFSLKFLFIIPAFFYSLLCETFMNGQSFGKMDFKN